MRSRQVRNEEGHVYGRTKVVKVTACGKRGYTSRKIAAAVAARARRVSGEPIEVYRCTQGCHLLHLGHPPGFKYAEEKRRASASDTGS